MQFKTIFGVLAAASLAAAAPAPDTEDEIKIVARAAPIDFYCKGAFVSGVAGTGCGASPLDKTQAKKLTCADGKYAGFPNPGCSHCNSYKYMKAVYASHRSPFPWRPTPIPRVATVNPIRLPRGFADTKFLRLRTRTLIFSSSWIMNPLTPPQISHPQIPQKASATVSHPA
ncbi:hypothetical protein BO70DRAFT_352165 [Aspergillus heteromorphus CBS 117.55]|uniref:Uncharacterized protein n=1 Tax=Aspergillus heteromorphus CBS 117.55 TaxID=1448321 RepID=A0A317WH92_9EURO|nr:uncharacterized protein BO70DRAFT_352165 [Aspergillus heteromorphus CBS 117.55]PWY85061.1 hypothetical protein BO70DRAFT_352165 [Aspergillus heteromorphus CBS 117.55]